jgi:hypothetical protein
MALQMDYTDSSGTDFPASYWMVSSLTLDVINKTAIINVVAYRDAAAKAAALMPIANLQVGFGSDTFLTYFSPTILASTSAYVAVYTALMASSYAAMFAGATTVA